MAGEERLENVNPEIFAKSGERPVLPEEMDDNVTDEIDVREIFDQSKCTLNAMSLLDLIKDINDPEHPLTLEELNVLQQAHIQLDNAKSSLTVRFTPTIPHCSMATLIGLSIRVRLLRVLPERFKVDVLIEPGTHSSESAINKQLADKERVAAALENNNLLQVVNQCLNIES